MYRCAAIGPMCRSAVGRDPLCHWVGPREPRLSARSRNWLESGQGSLQRVSAISMHLFIKDAHCSKLYNVIHVTILIYDTDILMILITILHGTSWLRFPQSTKIIMFRSKMYPTVDCFVSFWPFCILFGLHKLQNHVITRKQNMNLIEKTLGQHLAENILLI